MVQYLFNSRGDWVAFRDGRYVYDPNGFFLGSMAEDGENVADIEGRYFGTIYPEGRLYRKLFAPEIDAGFLGFPDLPVLPNYPSPPGETFLPVEADDIPELTRA